MKWLSAIVRVSVAAVAGAPRYAWAWGDVAANAPVVKEQLQKAGVRLAHMLDATLGK